MTCCENIHFSEGSHRKPHSTLDSFQVSQTVPPIINAPAYGLCKTYHIPCMQEARSQLLTSTDACVQLGQQKGELESQLGLMEHQARSLNQDKEHLEEELHDKQARLDQAAAAAQQAEASAAREAQTALHRCNIPGSVMVCLGVDGQTT